MHDDGCDVCSNACNDSGNGGEQLWQALVLLGMDVHEWILVRVQRMDRAVCAGAVVCTQFYYGGCGAGEVERKWGCKQSTRSTGTQVQLFDKHKKGFYCQESFSFVGNGSKHFLSCWIGNWNNSLERILI